MEIIFAIGERMTFLLAFLSEDISAESGHNTCRSSLAQGVWNFAGNHWHPVTTVKRDDRFLTLSLHLRWGRFPFVYNSFHETRRTVTKVIK
jgi:hypothetical protein